MPITHQARTGKTYYLHAEKSKRGRLHYFFSMNPEGALATRMPEEHEAYETVNGQVFLRKVRPKVILDRELAVVNSALTKRFKVWQFKTEVKRNVLVIYQGSSSLEAFTDAGFRFSAVKLEEITQRHCHYLPIMRFILTDKTKRLFNPERYCFRGSVDDWISIGPPAMIDRLADTYFKHLGRDSFYELY